MNAVLTCLLVTALLPIVCSWFGGYYRHKQTGAVDNKHPRLQAAQLEGAGHRAYAAQQNSWEALAVFSAALLALHAAGYAMAAVAVWSMIFVAVRVVYIAAYLANQDIVRSTAFLGGFGICMYFFYLALNVAG